MAKITAANSHWMAARSLEVRRAAKQNAQAREVLIKKLLAAEENRLLQAAEASAQLPANAPDDCVQRQIERVRKQVQLLQDRLEAQTGADELDAAALDRIASAIARLSELERQLSGRPLPGSLRPQPPRKQIVFTPPTEG